MCGVLPLILILAWCRNCNAFELGPVAQQLGTTTRTLVAFEGSLDSSSSIIFRGEPSYAESKNFSYVGNLPYNFKTPSMLVYCNSEQDIAATLALAVDLGRPLCVRAGGHDTSGASLCGTGGIVLDVSRFNQTAVFPEEGCAIAQAGVRLAELYNALSEYGLAAVGGLCSTVGLAGYSLGGGWSLLANKYGMGTDNVLAYTIALADGRLVTANETNDFSDLFWALRGGGHNNFGVMTSIKYKAYPLREMVVTNVTMNTTDLGAAADLLVTWQERYLNNKPRELTVQPQFGADASTGEVFIYFYCVLAEEGPGAEAELVELLQPLIVAAGDLGALGAVQRVPPRIVGELPPSSPIGGAPFPSEPFWEYKMGQYVNRSLTAVEYEIIFKGMLSLPEGAAFLSYFENYQGAMVDVDSAATAFVHRDPGYDLVMDIFVPGNIDASNVATQWLEELYFGSWKGLLNGLAYQNYPSLQYQPLRKALDMYYGSNLCRLVEVKRKYDPSNVFSYEQGVPLSLEGCDPAPSPAPAPGPLPSSASMARHLGVPVLSVLQLALGMLG